MSDVRHSSYLRNLFSGQNSLVNTVKLCRDLIRQGRERKELKRFTHFAVRGVSGCAIGGAVAVNQRKGLIVSRKPSAKSHAEATVEGCPINIAFNYVIVDDFVASGDTVIEIIKSITSQNPSAKCVGILTYHEDYKDYKPLTEENFSGRYKIREHFGWVEPVYDWDALNS